MPRPSGHPHDKQCMMSMHGFIPDSTGFPVRWFGEFAVVELPTDESFLPASALAGELCAVLDAGATGLIVEFPGAGVCDSACLDALMRTARRARGWASWLRLVIPDAGVRRVVRLVALDKVMPVYASVNEALAAAAREAATVAAGGGRRLTCTPALSIPQPPLLFRS
jgi:anti-sigma B factor antagonist